MRSLLKPTIHDQPSLTSADSVTESVAGTLLIVRARPAAGLSGVASLEVVIGAEEAVELPPPQAARAGADEEHALELALATRQRALRQLAVLAELRDDVTREHTDRVGHSAAILAQACGMDPWSVRTIAAAAMLHDVGKIAIPQEILLKPGRLDEEEMALMRRHAQIGAAILSSSGGPELRLGESIALSHHEHWDGGGYPHGLAGEAIPTAARIAAIADVFDALVHERPYKQAWSIEEALAEIASQRGRQFDPQLVDVFLRLDHERLLGHAHADVAEVRRRALATALAPVGRGRVAA